jgi:hypothetical protein
MVCLAIASGDLSAQASLMIRTRGSQDIRSDRSRVCACRAFKQNFVRKCSSQGSAGFDIPSGILQDWGSDFGERGAKEKDTPKSIDQNPSLKTHFGAWP